ncbi:Aldolase-type TIM barrel [Metarhizium album ARSEF 1941]|uniref:Aldolase-type TIM barrel n=1 Tax=Metarhizium album (strain ARSEF 1941) TaxID=1081103 RepID=A0A0B2WQ42_METAS|nr:Aldolase-type TIM barrel [Metarhizium album ARSEF 1941]KHN96143.1 Aldolase-type TIM barrel [Metarhizium album ARSEF 1941]
MAAVQQLLTSPPPRTALPTTGLNGETSADTTTTDRVSQSPVLLHGRSLRGAPEEGDKRIAVIIFGQGQERVVSIVAEVLSKPFKLKTSFKDVTRDDHGFVVGISARDAKRDIAGRKQELLVAINTHCVTFGMPPDEQLSTHCDYEFLYMESPYFRRYLSRFISFTLGQISHHEELMAKPRTLFMSTTFPDVRAALPNLDILTVGSDAIEIRVDLLREPLPNGGFSEVPSLGYVGEQVMLLRERTELPIIFTTRCTNENGRFPMHDPRLYHQYLYRAIQWGIEYIDIELWLPEEIRRDLWQRKGNSRIMSAFHDFSGTFKWPSQYAQDVFRRSCPYADIVKMIAIVNEPNENFELEYFRCKVKSEYPNAPPLSAVNMEETGQFTRTQNKVFTPITHPLLPIIAAPGQMSTAEIHQALCQLGQLPMKNIYGVISSLSRSAIPQAPFYEKCFNELGLPHRFGIIERQPNNFAGMEAWCNHRDFGGAYLDPGISVQTLSKHNKFFARLNNGQGPTLTEAARVIGIADTIVAKSASSTTSAPPSMPSSPHGQTSAGSSGQTGSTSPSLIFDNAGWRGIMHTLMHDLAPSAYFGRAAVVLASTSDDAAPAFYALKALKIAKIYTVGFRTPTALAHHAPPIEQFISLESLQRARSVSDERAPFVIVSALGPDKGNLVSMMLRAFAAAGQEGAPNVNKVFLNLADVAARKTINPHETAERSGFASYGAADVAAFTIVESLRLLVGQNVPYSFVRLASGRHHPF